MRIVKSIIYALVFYTETISLISAKSDNCTKKSDLTGKIEDYLNADNEERCWLIEVPFNFYLSIDILFLKFEDDDHNGLEITELNTGHKHTIDPKNKTKRLDFQSDVQITHFARNTDNQWWSKIILSYQIGKFPAGGVPESLVSAVHWLKKHRASSGGWQENTPRAIVALFLASTANFDGSNIEEELMATQIALETTSALLRSSITTNRLSMLVNALLVSCHNPRHFYGKNLVKRLKKQIEETSGFTNPVAYLTLCNANEGWPSKALNDLYSVLSTDSDYPFVRDIQAIAVLALSCAKNHNSISEVDNNTSELYNETILRFKSFKSEDGSFGNTHTTALITQALIADNQKVIEWNLKGTIEYLMRELDSSSVDFLTVYLILPILNRKTLADISNTHCLTNPKKKVDEIMLEVNNHSGPKMRVRYSLYIGDEKDVIHTMSLRVPRNFTAFEIMKMAQIEDQKYKFEVKTVSGKVYVYKIANIPNDPEAGKFWLQYVSSSNNTSNLTHISNPDELTMKNGQHLVMWYKTANI